jgi:hypothetical protein
MECAEGRGCYQHFGLSEINAATGGRESIRRGILNPATAKYATTLV